MSTDRFHKAAKDGYLQVLMEATRRDCNGKDEQGMTPTLYAAFHGNLEVLRLLCSRGGDPDKSDHFGNTALHLAAAQGHKAIVTFLVNFGANIYAMDIDERTPKELAGINNRDEILKYLDQVAAKMEASDKKKAKAMMERAKKDSEKRIKEFQKRQMKLMNASERLQKHVGKEQKKSIMSTLKIRMKSGSTSNLSGVGVGPAAPRNSFSAIVNGGTVSRGVTSTVQRKILASKNRPDPGDEDFKISEVEDGKRSVRSLKGFRRDSEVLYTGTVDSIKRGRLDDVFNGDESISYENETTDTFPTGNLTRSFSQPDIMQESHENGQEPASIFVRPGVGSIAFRKSITNTLHAISIAEAATEASSIGSAGSLAARQRHNDLPPFDDELSDPESSEDDDPNAPLERFLTAWGLGEYMPRFEEQKIDLDTLMLLTESDLKSLNLPLGPYRKLVTAINERKSALENPGEVTDSKL